MSSYVTSCCVMLRYVVLCYVMLCYVTLSCVLFCYVVLLLCVLVFWVCMHARMTCVCVCVLFLPYPHHYTSILGASASGLQPQLQLDKGFLGATSK